MPSKPVGSAPAPRMTRELPKSPIDVAADDPAFSRANAFVRGIQAPMEPEGEEATPRPPRDEPPLQQSPEAPFAEAQLYELSVSPASPSAETQTVVADDADDALVEDAAAVMGSQPAPKRATRTQSPPVIADRDRFVMGSDANKTTVYPTDEFKRRLREIATTHRVGEAMVIGYALHRMFGAMTDDEIVAPLKAMGYGMRRPRP